MIKILFLAANPKDTDRLRLDEEVRAIKERLRMTDLRDQFVVEQEHAVRGTDLQGCLLQHRPHVVHFSGHGSHAGEIVLEDATGQSKPVSPEALQHTFAVLKDNVRCVVLNACYSEPQARGIAESIDFVVGMSRAIGDQSAIGFARSFYQALGYGKTIPQAFELGRAQIALEGLGDQDVPKLTVAKGADAQGLCLTTNPPGLAAKGPDIEGAKHEIGERGANATGPSGEGATAGEGPPTMRVFGADDQPPRILRLLRAIERALAVGDLRNSVLGPGVLAMLENERDVELAASFNPLSMITAIRAADFYYAHIRRPSDQGDWQRDFAKATTPILVGMAWSLERSADAQAVVLRLCDLVPSRLHLKLIWPTEADRANELKNTIYQACRDATELECDRVLVELQRLTVIGPV